MQKRKGNRKKELLKKRFSGKQKRRRSWLGRSRYKRKNKKPRWPKMLLKGSNRPRKLHWKRTKRKLKQPERSRKGKGKPRRQRRKRRNERPKR